MFFFYVFLLFSVAAYGQLSDVIPSGDYLEHCDLVSVVFRGDDLQAKCDQSRDYIVYCPCQSAVPIDAQKAFREVLTFSNITQLLNSTVNCELTWGSECQPGCLRCNDDRFCQCGHEGSDCPTETCNEKNCKELKKQVLRCNSSETAHNIVDFISPFVPYGSYLESCIRPVVDNYGGHEMLYTTCRKSNNAGSQSPHEEHAQRFNLSASTCPVQGELTVREGILTCDTESSLPRVFPGGQYLEYCSIDNIRYDEGSKRLALNNCIIQEPESGKLSASETDISECVDNNLGVAINTETLEIECDLNENPDVPVMISVQPWIPAGSYLDSCRHVVYDQNNNTHGFCFKALHYGSGLTVSFYQYTQGAGADQCLTTDEKGRYTGDIQLTADAQLACKDGTRLMSSRMVALSSSILLPSSTPSSIPSSSTFFPTTYDSGSSDTVIIASVLTTLAVAVTFATVVILTSVLCFKLHKNKVSASNTIELKNR